MQAEPDHSSKPEGEGRAMTNDARTGLVTTIVDAKSIRQPA